MDQNSKVITVNDVINFIKEDSSKMASLIKGTSNNIKKIVETVDNSEIREVVYTSLKDKDGLVFKDKAPINCTWTKEALEKMVIVRGFE